jgi:Pentapeptide repeats (9 copies)
VITLEQWKKNFLEKDTCPWRGPKPMEPGDDDLLIGRGEDRDHFVHEVLTHQLVILHGESGVGKSSLLNVGLVGDLKERGFQPVVCSNWTRDAASPDQPEDFVAGKVAAELRLLGIDVDDASPRSMVEQLNEDYGELAVLVLDQFEELIRHQRPFFERAMDWVVRLNSKHNIHVVISLRSEYVHRLKPLNSQIRPFSMSTFELEALTVPDHIRDIMASGNPGQQGNTASLQADAGAGVARTEAAGLAISHQAIEVLLDEWNKVQQPEFRSLDVGLLHLQGALYALHARAKPGTIQVEHIRQMISAAAQRRRDVFTLGLSESVSRKLDLCEEACRDEDAASSLDEFLIVGTRAAVSRTVAHLSSGGFKLDREAWDLAELALERELRILNEVPAEATERAFRTIYGLNGAAKPAGSVAVDLLSVPRAVVAAGGGMGAAADTSAGSALGELGIAVSPWEVDPEGLSAGPMFGYPAQEVVIEELRRFAFALEWLTTSSLIRQTSPAVDCTMLSLIHDGFGEALENWADSEDTGPAPALTLLTGAQGDVFEWIRRDAEECWPQFDGLDQDHTIVNLRWRNCRVTARFRHVVFANCDFRGTRFEKCHFEGAVFVNCLLDGSTFGDCDIVGAVSESATAYDKEGMPSFALTGLDALTRAALSHYRDEDFSGAELYSVTSGIAVTNRPGTRSDLLEWSPQRGGLTMYGGRLSSLMVRSGRFRDGGELALRHIAGSSLDITEQGAAKIQIFGSSIRGLSISRGVGDTEEQLGDIQLTVQGSVLANTWFDEGLTGTARFDYSVVWQLLNVSKRSCYQVTMENCTRYGVVNIEDTTNAGPQADFAEDGIADRSELVHQAGLMAYRREPAMVELDELRGQ